MAANTQYSPLFNGLDLAVNQDQLSKLPLFTPLTHAAPTTSNQSLKDLTKAFHANSVSQAAQMEGQHNDALKTQTLLQAILESGAAANTKTDELKKSLDANTSAAEKGKSSLDANTIAAEKGKSSLDANTTAAEKGKSSLDANTTAVGNLNTALGANTTAAANLKTSIDAMKTSIDSLNTSLAVTAPTDEVVAQQRMVEAFGFVRSWNEHKLIYFLSLFTVISGVLSAAAALHPLLNPGKRLCDNRPIGGNTFRFHCQLISFVCFSSSSASAMFAQLNYKPTSYIYNFVHLYGILIFSAVNSWAATMSFCLAMLSFAADQISCKNDGVFYYVAALTGYAMLSASVLALGWVWKPRKQAGNP